MVDLREGITVRAGQSEATMTTVSAEQSETQSARQSARYDHIGRTALPGAHQDCRSGRRLWWAICRDHRMARRKLWFEWLGDDPVRSARGAKRCGVGLFRRRHAGRCFCRAMVRRSSSNRANGRCFSNSGRRPGAAGGSKVAPNTVRHLGAADYRQQQPKIPLEGGASLVSGGRAGIDAVFGQPVATLISPF